MFDSWRGFSETELSDEWQTKLAEQARVARGHILRMTTIAASGHPGGSMSSIEAYVTLYNLAKVDPKQPRRDDRDRIIVSHGHTSPGVYSALALAGFFDIEPVLYGFRKGGSPFEGHVEQSVPGVEWDTGNLGQGLSVGVGKAIYSRLSGLDFQTYVLMGDGEQQKGQIAEARRLAVKYRLNNVTALIDYNGLQISGKIEEIMPQDIAAGWKSDGWKIIEVDAHDLKALYQAFRAAKQDDSAPYVIMARSVMGKGVSFMENKEGFHGAPVKADKIGEALAELGTDNNIDALKARREKETPGEFDVIRAEFPKVNPGPPIEYAADAKSDCRSAWGKALVSIAEANEGDDGPIIVVFDNDLAGSVKTKAFGDKYPDRFFQAGIAEHNTASVAGALSAESVVAVWSAFGVFGVDETYNQARLNDINHTNLKLFCTHSGIDVGEDGKTHQCVDYFALLNSTFGWKVITPADANQTDRIARYTMTRPGNFAVIMGRSIKPTVTAENGQPFFGKDYQYRYGRMETIRSGEKTALVCSGNMLHNGLDVWKILGESGINITLISVSDWSDLALDDLKNLGTYENVITLEDHVVQTGLGAAIGTAMLENGFFANFTRLGVTKYGPSGKPTELYKMLGLDGVSVAEKIKRM